MSEKSSHPCEFQVVLRYKEMAATKQDRSEREELNSKIYALRKHTGWSYRKIASKLGLSKSRIRDVVKRSDEHGVDVKDAPRSGHPSKLTKVNRKRVLEVVDENPRLSLREITNVANVGLNRLSIDKIISKSSFRLKIPRK